MKTPSLPWCATLGVVLVAGVALAQDAARSYFPLSVGTVWTYQLELKRGADTQRLIYTSEVVKIEQLDGLDCFVLEQRSDDKLFQKGWYAIDAEGVVRNPRRQNGGRVHNLLEGEEGTGPRVVFDPGASEGDSWAWHSADGSAKGTITVESLSTKMRLPKPLRAEFDCVVLLERGEFQAGGRTATQERRMWLAPDIGLVKETSEIRIGDEVANQSEATLYSFPRSD